MLSSEEISTYLGMFKNLTIKDMWGIFNMAHTRRIPAEGIYIAEGTTTTKLALIRKGLMRAYRIKENGDEVTFILRWENQIIASHDAIILQQPSRFIYQALEDTAVLEIDYEKVQEIFNSNPKLSAHRNAFLLQMLADAMDRVESFVLLSPEERYLKLVKEKPGIANRVPDKHLATLLGITPVSLSRIRKRIVSAPRR